MLRAEMSVQKPLSHLLTARSRAQARRRLAAYFTEGCPSVPVDGDDGRRVLLATRLAMNYGFAYRMATYAALRDLARSAFGATASAGGRLAAQLDLRGGGRRRPRVRAPAQRLPGLPGGADGIAPRRSPRPDNRCCCPAPTVPRRTCAYRAAGAHRSLYTACHGTGSIISAFERSGRSGTDPLGRVTARHRYDGSAPVDVPHLDDRGVDEALGHPYQPRPGAAGRPHEALRRADMITPAADTAWSALLPTGTVWLPADGQGRARSARPSAASFAATAAPWTVLRNPQPGSPAASGYISRYRHAAGR